MGIQLPTVYKRERERGRERAKSRLGKSRLTALPQSVAVPATVPMKCSRTVAFSAVSMVTFTSVPLGVKSQRFYSSCLKKKKKKGNSTHAQNHLPLARFILFDSISYVTLLR